MFTGIVEDFGEIKKVVVEGSNYRYFVAAPFVNELKVDQSVSHDGVCLTVESIQDDIFTVVAVDETLQKTTLKSWKEGTIVNLERGMKMTDRLDGHLVQGHVDTVGQCDAVEQKEGSTNFTFSFPASFASLIIEKGSICINGVSLTVFDVKENSFTVTIIPYTIEHTTFKFLQKGDQVNIEFDVIGKYILRNESLKS